MNYKLIAFVGRGKHDPAPLWSGDEGYQSFETIFDKRPDWSQFAILQDADNKYLCVDLFDTVYDIALYKLIKSEPLVFDDLDAAVMAAQLKL